MKKLLILVIIVALTVFAAQMVMAQKGASIPSLLSSLFQKKTISQSTEQKKQENVLGESDVQPQENASEKVSTLQSVQQKLDPVISSVSTTIEDVVAKTTGMLTGKEQKIEVDKALEDMQKRAEKIPEDVLNKAKYEYCKQVVSDYEKR